MISKAAQGVDRMAAEHNTGSPHTSVDAGPDKSLDTGLAGHTELRIHGVSGTPPEAVLSHPLLKRVAGDDKSGFYRRWYPGGLSADLNTNGRRLEAYSWGHLTSGSFARAAWLMLLPFMLANLAHWMLPALPAAAGRVRTAAGRASAVLLRLFGLSLTLMMVLAAVQMAMDVAGWQCGGTWRCATSSPLTTVLADGWAAEPGARVALTALVPVAVVFGIGLLGRRTRRRTEPEPDVSVAAEGEHPMSRPSFWRGNPGMSALRTAHVTAATALIAAAVAWPASTLAASGAARVAGLVVCAVALALVAGAAVLVATEGIAGRSAHHTTVAVNARRISLGLFLVAVVFSVWDHGTWEPATDLPGVRSAVLLAFGAAMLLILLLAGAVAAQLPWRQGRDGFRVTMRGLGAPAVSTIAFLVAGGFSAGLIYRVTDLLGQPVISVDTASTVRTALDRIIDDDALPFAVQQSAWSTDLPLVLPPSYAWAGAAGAVIVVAVVVIAAGIAVSAVRRIGATTTQVADEYRTQQTAAGDPGQPSSPSPTTGMAADEDAARRIAIVTVAASLTDGSGRFIGRVVLAAGLVLLTGIGVYASGADNWQLVERPPLSTLTTFGTWMMGAFAIGLVGLVWSTARNPALRRVVGILWDVGSFWPRVAHPLAPPSYGERAVPELVDRVTALTAEPNSRVILSGHSQGSVLAAATIMQLPRNVAARVGLITHGSPLRRLYARHFPAYLDESVLRSVSAIVGGRWRNLYRETDPIGSWVLHDPADESTGGPDVDVRLLDPPTLDGEIAGHGEYWNDTRYPAELDTVAHPPDA